MSKEGISYSNDKAYYYTFDGEFRTKVKEGTPGALPRINKNGVEIFERSLPYLEGIIENVYFEDSDFGMQIKVMLDKLPDGKNPVISFIRDSSDGRALMRKLPAVDFSKEVRIVPYSFIPDGATDTKSGFNIYQQATAGGEFVTKIDSFFFDKDTKTMKDGYPAIDWDNASEKERKIYAIERDEFLADYTKNHIIPKFADKTPKTYDDAFDKVIDETSPDPDQIPF